MPVASGAATEVTLAAAEVHLGNIDTATAASATDLAALEVLVTSTNSKIDTMDAVLDASLVKQTALETLLTAANVDHAANEVLLTGIDADTDAIKTSTAACATDLAALEVLQTATNSKIDTLDAVVDAAEAHLGNIETSVQLIDDVVKAEDAAHSSGDKGVMFLGVHQSSQADFGADGDYVPLSINDDGELRVTTAGATSQTTTNVTSSQNLATTGTNANYSIDTGTSSSYIRFFLDFGANSYSDADVQVSHDNSNFIPVQNVTQQTTAAVSGGTNYFADISVLNPPRYVRLFNTGGSSVITIVKGIIVFG